MGGVVVPVHPPGRPHPGPVVVPAQVQAEIPGPAFPRPHPLGRARRNGRAAPSGAYAGSMVRSAGPSEGTELHPAGSTTLAPARPEPDLDDGDHDRFAHIVL